jgi:DNA-binding NarL/FixJ family response regulator
MRECRIVVVEDSTMVKQLITMVLKQNSDFNLIGEFSNGKDAIDFCKPHRADLVIVDSMLPDITGSELCKILLEQHLMTRVLAISGYQRADLIKEMIGSGASGFVFKEDPWDCIEKAISSIMQGKKYFSPQAAAIMSEALHSDQSAESALTKREKEILMHLGNGQGVKEIAFDLKLSPKTINNHITNIKHKLQIFDLPRLVLHSIKLGLVKRN